MRNYLHRDQALAGERQFRKLEMGYAQRVAEVKTGTNSTKMSDKTVDRFRTAKKEGKSEAESIGLGN